MPVGTTNCTLKPSFSLSSLRSSTGVDRGSTIKLKNERLYHSLTNKFRKCKEDKQLWRKSWGSVISQDEKELWEAFQADYDYLMAQNILEKDILEILMEKNYGGTPSTPLVWSHSEFLEQFAQLYSKLKTIQNVIFGKKENDVDFKTRAEMQEDLQRQTFRLEIFNEESKKLVIKYPTLKNEVSWLVNYVNDTWNSLKGLLNHSRNVDDGYLIKNSKEKIEQEMKCLRKWLRELDIKLKPLSFQYGWTKGELEMKAKEHMVLHRDVEAHRNIVSSILKLCEKTEPSIVLASRVLERKYYEYYLRSLEWHYYIESLLKHQKYKNTAVLSNESDGEPVAKIGRYTYKKESETDKLENNNWSFSSVLKKNWKVESDSFVHKRHKTQVKEKNYNNLKRQRRERSCESISGSRNGALTVSSVETKPRNPYNFSSAKNEKNFKLKFGSATPSLYKFTGVHLKDSVEEIKSVDDKNIINRSCNTSGYNNIHFVDVTERQVLDMTEPEIELKEELEEKKSRKETEFKGEESTSSEDGWMYLSGSLTEKPKMGSLKKSKATMHVDTSETNFWKGKQFPKQINYYNVKVNPKETLVNKEPISSTNKILVDQADELVRNKSRLWRTRKGKLKNSKEDEKPLDSCDASGECTDGSDDLEFQFSENKDGSVSSCKRSASAEGISENNGESKVLEGGQYYQPPLRQNYILRNRPWSMSNVSLLKNFGDHNLKTQSSFSESALTQILTCRDKVKDFPNDFNKSTKDFLLKESGGLGYTELSKRKKTKFKKRMNKKSESNSDNVTLSGSDSPKLISSDKQMSNISYVLSPESSKMYHRERHSSSDEEPNEFNCPKFVLGPKDGVVTITTDTVKVQTEEQLSLNSDQAYWDNYQEKYQSEAYSEEPPDSDTAKKLLEFGEDYGKFLGNQSDCASSWSFVQRKKILRKCDSDSDVEEVKKLLIKSQDQLDSLEKKVNKNVENLKHNLKIEDIFSKIYLNEICAICKQQVNYLTKLLNEEKYKKLFKDEESVRIVKESWENFKSLVEAERAKQLLTGMNILKDDLLNWAANIETMETLFNSREELEAKIVQIKNDLNFMKKGKSKLVQANVSVHKFLAITNHAELALKEEVVDLYHVWDQAFCRVTSQLFNLQNLSQAWNDFEEHLSQLQCALRTDTLKVLDFALKSGNSINLTNSLQDIAGILFEKELNLKDSTSNSENPHVSSPSANPSLRPIGCTTEGSFSDSGISDSGSEQELNEREKRLVQLKRLAKRLESILAPGSQALLNIFKKIEQSENELKELQKTCKNLILRSASVEELKTIISKTSNFVDIKEDGGEDQISKPISIKKLENMETEPSNKECDGVDSIYKEKPEKKNWWWRIYRYALPFYLAFFGFMCVAYVMEPRCCDSLNNLDVPFRPQLRYDLGPPPV